MRDADQRGVFGQQAAVQARLVGGVEGAGGFVEDDEAWRADQHAGKGQALLLAQRQSLGPIDLGVEPAAALHQVGQVHIVQCLLQHRVVQFAVELRVQQLAAQAAHLHVGALRQEHAVGHRRALDAAFARTPQPGNGAQQRTLAAAAFADDQQPVALVQREAQIAHQLALAVGRVERYALQAEFGRLGGFDGVAPASRQGWRFGRYRLVALARLRGQRRQQAVDALDAGGEARQAFEVVDDDRHRAQHRQKGARRLDGLAHFELARQHQVGDQDVGQDDGDLVVRLLKEVEVELLAQQPLVVAQRAFEAAAHLLQLGLLAAVKGNRFGVFAHPHQAEAEVRLALELKEVQAHQRRAKHLHREPGAERRVRHQHVHQRVRDAPQHPAESHQLHQRAEADQQEVQRALREGVDVFGNALVGVVDAAFGRQLVKALVEEVAPQQPLGQPAPPVVAQRVAHKVVQRARRHEHRHHDQADHDGVPEALAIALGQRRGHLAGLVVQHDGDLRLGQQHGDQQDQEAPGLALFTFAPVGRGDGPEALPDLGREEVEARPPPVAR